MKVGQLLAELRLDKKGFDSGLASSGLMLGKFAGLAAAAGAAVVMGLVAGMGKAIGAAIEFEASMTRSTAIMIGLTQEMRADMESSARAVALTTTFSASEAADSYFYLASAGLDAEQSIAALPIVSKFAQAGAFDMALATDLLTDAQSALGMTIRDDAVANMENMVRVSDVLVRANTLANATVQQFSESLTNRAGAALKAVNKDVEEGVAVLAAFADQGVKGNVAGTALAMVLRDLQRASVANVDAWKEHNIAVYDSEGNMRNVADIIGDLENALEGMSVEQQRATMMQLGFTDRSMGYIIALLGQSEAIRNYEKELRSAAGYTEQVAANQLTSMESKLALLGSRWEDMMITIGQKLMPVMEAFIFVIANVVIPIIMGLVEVIGWLIEPLVFLSEVFTDVFEGMSRTVNNFALDFGDMGDRIHRIADQTGREFQEVKDFIRYQMEELGMSFEEAAYAADQHFGSMTRSARELAVESGQQWEAYQNAISVGSNRVGESLVQVGDEYEHLSDTVELAMDDIVEDTRTGLQRMIDAFREAEDPVRNAGQAAMDAYHREIEIGNRLKVIEAELGSKGLRDALASEDEGIRRDAEMRRHDLIAEQMKLQNEYATMGDETAQIARTKALMTSDFMQEGLASRDPEIRALFLEWYRQLQLRVNDMEGAARNSQIGANLAAAVRRQAGQVYEELRTMGATSRALFPSSEPKDPRSPFRGITKGWNFGKVLQEGIKESMRGFEFSVPTFDVADMVAPSPGLGAQMASGVAGERARGAARGGDTYNIHGVQPGDVEREVYRAQRRAAVEWGID